jgi:hypothetical protein
MTATILILVAAAILVNVLIARARQRRHARRIYQEALTTALEDGILTDEEAADLERIRSEKDLSEREVRMAAVALYRRTLHDAAADEYLSPEEDEQLQRMQKQLGLSEGDIGTDLLRVRRLRTLAGITAGRLPEVTSPIDLVADERCHWVVRASIAQRIALPAQQRLRAVRFPILETAPFHAHGDRDALRPSDVILPTDLGVLVVSSRRTVLEGARRSISVPHARLQSVMLFRDGIAIEEINGNVRYFLVDDPELTAAVVLHAARIRRAEIRPSSSGRSA